MWHEITSNTDITKFMDKICSFHDSCIKEMKYLSGAYVDEKLSMYPINDLRILRVIIQRQFCDDSMVELEFSGLKFLKLFPCDDEYTCEILDSTMIMHDDNIYWCDSGGVSEKDLFSYKGTMICASKLRWRSVDGNMGQKEFYISKV